MKFSSPLALVGPKRDDSAANSRKVSKAKMNHVWAKVFQTQLRLTECLADTEERDAYFEGNKEDELPGLSKEDTQFLYQTVPAIKINDFGSIEMPLLSEIDQTSTSQRPKNWHTAGFRRRSKNLEGRIRNFLN